MGKNNTKTIVTAVQCPKCKDYIFSRTKHDFRSCSCKSVSVDGGFDYTKLHWSSDVKREDISYYQIKIEQSKEDLFDDWNNFKDKYGILKRVTKEEIVEQQ